MKSFFSALQSFISSLSVLDIFFFASVVVLIILIVVLIYITKINKEDDYNEISNDESLESIAKEIDERKPLETRASVFEQEQEKNAIISYDELLAASNNLEVDYDDEEEFDDLKVKKVNSIITKEVELPKVKKEDSYLQEENYLKYLKDFKNNL